MSGGVTLVLVARRSEAAWLHIGGVPETECILRICAREGVALQPSLTNIFKTRYDLGPNYSSLESVQQKG